MLAISYLLLTFGMEGGGWGGARVSRVVENGALVVLLLHNADSL